jgi:aryl-alcohol dehydrogenase-like predicted oxidoreductase
MEQVRLGGTGLKVSRLCLGCMTYGSPQWRPWVLDMETSKPFFRTAIEKGITFFDTANIYSIGESEVVTGWWLREFARREEVVVATKVNGPMGEGANEKGLSR